MTPEKKTNKKKCILYEISLTIDEDGRQSLDIIYPSGTSKSSVTTILSKMLFQLSNRLDIILESKKPNKILQYAINKWKKLVDQNESSVLVPPILASRNEKLINYLLSDHFK